jgi:hypothetical protein
VGSPRNRGKFTTDRACKRAVRERMAQTGARCTVARRALAGDDDGRAVRREGPIAAVLRPGRVTGFVSGGGMTTLGSVLPHLVRLEDEGHHLSIAPHGSGQPGDPMSELPILLGQVIARGLSTPMEMAQDTATDRTLLRQVAEHMPASSLRSGATRDSRLADHLREHARKGQAGSALGPGRADRPAADPRWRGRVRRDRSLSGWPEGRSRVRPAGSSPSGTACRRSTRTAGMSFEPGPTKLS